jgi:hypothetical protein
MYKSASAAGAPGDAGSAPGGDGQGSASAGSGDVIDAEVVEEEKK